MLKHPVSRFLRLRYEYMLIYDVEQVVLSRISDFCKDRRITAAQETYGETTVTACLRELLRRG
jgi:hypothetical protein